MPVEVERVVSGRLPACDPVRPRSVDCILRHSQKAAGQWPLSAIPDDDVLCRNPQPAGARSRSVLRRSHWRCRRSRRAVGAGPRSPVVVDEILHGILDDQSNQHHAALESAVRALGRDRPAAADRHRGRGPQRRPGALRRVRGRRRHGFLLLRAARRPRARGRDDLDQRPARHARVREAGLGGHSPYSLSVEEEEAIKQALEPGAEQAVIGHVILATGRPGAGRGRSPRRAGGRGFGRAKRTSRRDDGRSTDGWSARDGRSAGWRGHDRGAGGQARGHGRVRGLAADRRAGQGADQRRGRRPALAAEPGRGGHPRAERRGRREVQGLDHGEGTGRARARAGAWTATSRPRPSSSRRGRLPGAVDHDQQPAPAAPQKAAAAAKAGRPRPREAKV